jgi:hypothetical protein
MRSEKSQSLRIDFWKKNQKVIFWSQKRHFLEHFEWFGGHCGIERVYYGE